MNGTGIFSFPESREGGRRLSEAMGLSHHSIFTRRFPDRESLVRVPARSVGRATIVYRSLDDPDRKLVQLLLAAAALRDAGAKQVLLVAPYLGYMRQDKAFRPGEAVSQRVIGSWLAGHFDGLVTVDPHLHRTPTLAEAVPGIPSRAISAAPALADMIAQDLRPNTVLVGPDEESRAWTENLAGLLGCAWIVGSKRRSGDREVAVTIPRKMSLQGRAVVLVDDILSSGETLRSCAEQALAAGASQVEAVVTHCVATPGEIARLKPQPLWRIRSTDSIARPTSAVAIAPILSVAISSVLGELESEQ